MDDQDERPRQPERPLPGDHKEIARGSGPAAILLFLHIAVTGYLGFTIYYLLRHNHEVFWNLALFSAWLYYYLPAAFAVMTYLPSDGLTRGVGRVAMVAGALAWACYGLGWVLLLSGQADNAGAAGWESLGAVMAGCLAGAVFRLAFRAGIGRHGEEN